MNYKRAIGHPVLASLHHLVTQLVYPASVGAMLYTCVRQFVHGGDSSIGESLLGVSLIIHFAVVWLGTEVGLRRYSAIRFFCDIAESVTIASIVVVLFEAPSAPAWVFPLLLLSLAVHAAWRESQGEDITSANVSKQSARAILKRCWESWFKAPSRSDKVLRWCGAARIVSVLGVWAGTLMFPGDLDHAFGILAALYFVITATHFWIFATAKHEFPRRDQNMTYAEILADRVVPESWR